MYMRNNLIGDIAFKEKAMSMSTGNTVKVMASINNLVISVIHQSNSPNATLKQEDNLLLISLTKGFFCSHSFS